MSTLGVWFECLSSIFFLVFILERNMHLIMTANTVVNQKVFHFFKVIKTL